MSEFLGYNRGVQYNNDIINRNRQIQGEIHQNNINNLTSYNVLEKQATSNYDGTEKALESQEGQSKQTEGKTEGGEFLNDVRNVYKTGKKYRDIADGIEKQYKSISRGKFIASSSADLLENAPEYLAGDTRVADGIRNAGDSVLDLGQDTSEVAEDVIRGGTTISRGADLSGVARYGAEALENTLQGSARGVGEAFTGTRSALSIATQGTADTIDAVRSGGQALQEADLSGLASAGGKAVSSISKVGGALDSLGKAGEGLAVLSAGSDIYDDATGGFNKLNSNEKISNVAGISAGVFAVGSLAGSLESTGAMLDATGIGAELGVAFNVAGAVAGGVSALEDYIGGKKKQKQQQTPMNVAPAPTPQAQRTAPVSALQSGGVALSGYN